MTTLRGFFVAAVLGIAAALPATAHDTAWTTTLSGPAEAPPNASPGFGNVTITIDFDLVTMHVQASFADLVGMTTASHIHCCTAVPGTGTAGVATVTPSFTDFPLGVTSGSYDHIFDMTLASSYNPSFVTAQGGISQAFNALVAGLNNGSAYYNIHTSVYSGGEIRGFLQVAAVPEPESYALMLAGLGVMALVMRRRR